MNLKVFFASVLMVSAVGCGSHSVPVSDPPGKEIEEVDHLKNEAPIQSPAHPAADGDGSSAGDEAIAGDGSSSGDGTPSGDGTISPAAGEDATEAAGLAPGEGAASSSEDALAKPGAAIQVDAAAGELVIPCFFVNPTQRIEVFGCHESGPAHETVVAFTSTGEQIYQALLGIGLRPPTFWNATRDREIRWNLGDRVVISLRWERGGRKFDVAAEKVLQEPLNEPTDDTERPAGFVPFIRGYTFGGERKLMGDPPALRIPPITEITIGDPTRQKSEFSMLFHPNDLDELTPWMGPLEISPEAIPDHTAMVEERVPVSLVVHKVAGEVELLSMARRMETDAGRIELLNSLGPIAEGIDRAKARYAAMVDSVQALLKEGGDPRNLKPEDRDRIAQKLVQLQSSGHLEAAQIRAQYLQLFDAQERYRVAAILKLNESLKTKMSPQMLRIVENRYTQGFSFETRLAAIDVELSKLETKPGKHTEQDALLVEAFNFDKDAQIYRRDHFWMEQELGQVRQRMKELDPQDRIYTLRLFQEEEGRLLAELRQITWRIEEIGSRAQENRWRAQERWLEHQDEILARRTKALAGIELGELESKRIELLGEIRWKENDLEKDQEDETKVAAHRQKLGSLADEKKKLDALITGKQAAFDKL